MNRQEARHLFKKYNNGTATLQEQIQLEQWYHTEQAAQRLSEEEAGFIFLKEEIWKGTLERAGLKTRKTFILWKKLAMAASVILITGLGLYLYHKQIGVEHTAFQNDINPGKTGATLTLGNGKKIILSEAVNGELAKESGVVITKSDNGQLTYVISNNTPSVTTGNNTLTTAKGETYDVQLPDGTLAVLNAASSLTYNPGLNKKEKRIVELKGEAYFEVAKVFKSQKGKARERLPFIVKTDKQEIEVLGTHFNINSYADEGNIKTTLLEGSVKVSPLPETARRTNGIILKPGQQSILTSNHTLQVTAADIESVMAWKNGMFVFKKESLPSIMLRVARWYNIEVIYEDDFQSQPFTGTVPKFQKLSSVLKILELTGTVHFKIEGRRVTVMK